MGKSVLIITYYYKHKNAMASVRPIKLAKYFKKVGLDVTVLTSDQKDTWTKEYIKPVADPRITEIYATENRRWAFIQKYLSHRGRVGQKRIANSGSAVQTDSKAAGGLAAVKARIKKTVSWLFYFNLARQEDICMYKGLKAEIKRRKLKDFDAVIATYPTYGAFLTGIWMKKTGRCKQFIADFRDPLYNPGFRNKKAEANYDLKCLKKTLKAADKVVCVSNGIADGIKAEFSGYKKPISVITNGFDPDDVQTAEVNRHNDGKTHFVYTGTLYHGKRCVNMLCEAIKLLEADKRCKADEFIFEYAGPDGDEMINQLKDYGYEQNLINRGMVSREESITMQQNADALLLLTWNEAKYQGVIPGKLFEYMSGGNIPIIALVTGDTQNSEVAEIIRKSDCGFACEEAVSGDIKELADYLYRLINGNVGQNRSVEPYNYENIAKMYSEFIG